MATIPSTSLSKLAGLRGRERFFQVIWGCVRWLALAVTLFCFAVFIDWQFDKNRDTPVWLRGLLAVLQVITLLIAAIFWILVPLISRKSLILLARRVEKKIPEYDHRLITSIQLTRGDAKVAGMSPQLIRMVSEEAESISDKHNLKALADTRRLKWSAALLVWPLGVAAGMLLFFGSALLTILALRQGLFFANIPIPRDIALTNATKDNPWPAGDEVEIKYDVTSKAGKLDKDMKGKLFYTSSETNREDECELAWDSGTEFAPEHAMFKAKVPQSSRNFTYRARLGDGRSRRSDEVMFEPRPQSTIETVWVKPPSYITGRPEAAQTNKNIRAYEGSSARVRIFSQKPLAEAQLLLCRVGADGGDIVVSAQDMKRLPPEGTEEDLHYPAESGSFDLLPGANAPTFYKIVVKDKNGFTSAVDPRGTIEVTQPDKPFVKMLPETYIQSGRGKPKTEDDVLEGMPVPLGGKFPVEYLCRSDIGICRPFRRKSDNRLIEPAWFVYQINDTATPSGTPILNYLPLKEVPETDKTGRYDIENASFAELGYQAQVLNNQVPFVARTADRAGAMPRSEGGGFFTVNIDELRKLTPDGKLTKLELNDRITYWIEIFDCDTTAENREPGRSEARVKYVKTPDEVAEILKNWEKEREAIQELAKRQQEISARNREKP
jgi:hypothetical protein